MKEVKIIMTDSEFQEFLVDFSSRIDMKSLSLISRRCQIIDALKRLDPEIVFTVAQLQKIFDLAD